MEIIVQKVTKESLMRTAAGMTIGKASNMDLITSYKAEHSPARTQMFWIEMIDIPTSSSVHLVRHKTWVEHFVKSNRPDRGGDVNANRSTPVSHGMFVNAQELIEMSKVRLCYKADPVTRLIMEKIRTAMCEIDSALSLFMIPKCIYRNGLCGEPKPCGGLEKQLSIYSYYNKLFM